MLEELITLGLVTLSQAMPPSNIERQLATSSEERSSENLRFLENVSKTKPNSRQTNNAAILLLNDVIKYSNDAGYSIKRSIPVSDFSGNYYVLVEFNPFGYGIYCLGSGDFVELAPFARSPYEGFNNGDCLRYVPNRGYYSKNSNGSFRELMSNTLVTRESENALAVQSTSIYSSVCTSVDYQKQSFVLNGEAVYTPVTKGVVPGVDEDANIKPSDRLVYADKEVPYSWYFKLNIDQFPKNTIEPGICGYTALSMILGYHEIFSSAGYFSKEESKQYIKPSKGEYGHSVPEIVDEFPRAVWGKEIGRSTPFDMEVATSQFLSGKDVQYSDGDWYWVFSDIRREIDKGAPSIYFGEFRLFDNDDYYHAMVVYGYFEEGDKLLCHWGYDGFSQVIANKRAFYNEGGYYTLINKTPHRHKAYFKSDFGVFRCGCGMLVDC